jgi:hypothetical protein
VDGFEVAGGSVTGRRHALSGRSNQDAWAFSSTERAVLAVVADGCGSGAHSEVGARLGARLLLSALEREVVELGNEPDGELLERCRVRLLAQLLPLASAMCGAGHDAARAVDDHFLFTLVGAAVTPRSASIFALGDGVAVVNGEAVLASREGAPPYAGYALLAGDAPRFQVLASAPEGHVSSVLIGTDGLADLGGPPALAGFWSEDRFFGNPFAISRALARANRPAPGAPAPLQDDATLVVLRRVDGRLAQG